MSSPVNPNQREPQSQGFAENPHIPNQEDNHNSTITHVPARTLSPISSNSMNSANPTTADSRLPVANSYERKEYNNDGLEENLAVGSTPRVGPSAGNPLMMLPPSSSRTNGATSIPHAHPDRPPPPPPRAGAIPMSTTVRNISAEFGGSRTFASSSAFPIAEDSTGQGDPQGWSSAVGKANLGKSGRVIERLMGEKDMLKRDLTVQRLQADEARNELKMIEMKMEQMSSEYETQLHDASINKTLLKRRERQLTELKAQIDGERHRADTAVESERGWKDQMDKAQRECKIKVEEASNHALLVEGRYNALASHWDEQGNEVKGAVNKLSKEISTLVDERHKDYVRMNALQATCDQQNAQLDNLQKQKEDIAEAFRLYKLEQEQGLKDIKQKAARQEKANEEALVETKKVMGELKWALQVKKNVKGADTK